MKTKVLGKKPVLTTNITQKPTRNNATKPVVYGYLTTGTKAEDKHYQNKIKKMENKRKTQAKQHTMYTEVLGKKNTTKKKTK